jgi:peptide-methionine (S)-S-oxide reductase
MRRLLTGLFFTLIAGTAVGQQPTPAAPAGMAKAIVAAGCFWCMEEPFDKLPGVLSTTSGYTGGHKVNPTYKEVTSDTTGHTEAVEIVFDPKIVTYAKILEVFWLNVDPTDKNGQFCDRGKSYRPEIFVIDEEQRKVAEASLAEVTKTKKFKEPIVVPITKAGVFYAAEDYHQDFYKKSALRYGYYRAGCGRDARLEQLWGKAAVKK